MRDLFFNQLLTFSLQQETKSWAREDEQKNSVCNARTLLVKETTS